MGEWSESEHMERYFDLVGSARVARERSPYPRPHLLGRRTPSTTLQ